MWFRRSLPPKARDFNWHTVIGFWSAVPLFIVVLSAVVISYTWAGNLVYRVVGETPPAPRANQPANQPRSPSNTANQAPAPTPTNLNAAWQRAERQVNDWLSISLTLPANASAPLVFNVDRGNGGQPQKRGQLVLDSATGEVVRWEPFESNTRGRQLRSILRFAHTGEVVGVAGQTIAGLASIGGAFLVCTGLTMAVRRFLSWAAKSIRASKSTADITKPISESVVD